jgi:hypothetical protein
MHATNHVSLSSIGFPTQYAPKQLVAQIPPLLEFEGLPIECLI